MPKILDYDTALKRLDNDRALYVELVYALLADYRSRHEDLGRDIAAGDADGVARGGHALKSALESVGAMAASETARLLETAGRDCDLARASTLLSALADDLSLFSEELERIIDE